MSTRSSKRGARILGKAVARAALFCSFLAFALAVVAQTDAPVARPEVKVGDRWTYRRMDYVRNVPDGTYELRVTFVGRNAIHAVVAKPEGRESDATYTSEWTDVVSPEGTINVHERGLLQFPLEPGSAYKVDWTLENPRRRRTSRIEVTVKVIGWEDIAVPAGKFRALRVEAEGRYRRVDGPYGGWKRHVFWYAPDVKRWVRLLVEESRMRGSPNKFGEELVEFLVQ